MDPGHRHRKRNTVSLLAWGMLLYFTNNYAIINLDKLEFGGQWPLTMRTRCGAFRYCPDPLGIVTATQLDKLESDE